MTESASSTSGQEFDVFSVMDWKDGVGTLPGSDLKVRCFYYLHKLCVFVGVYFKMNTYPCELKALNIALRVLCNA